MAKRSLLSRCPSYVRVYIRISMCTFIKPNYMGFGHAVARLLEALRYKMEGRGFYSHCCQWKFHRLSPSGRITVQGSTQSLTYMSTRIFPGR